MFYAAKCTLPVMRQPVNYRVRKNHGCLIVVFLFLFVGRLDVGILAAISNGAGGRVEISGASRTVRAAGGVHVLGECIHRTE